MQRYLQLLGLITKFSLADSMVYPPSFWLAILGKAGRVFLFLLFYQAIFQFVPTLAGWSYPEALLLVATFNIFQTICAVTVFRNLVNYLSMQLMDGTFDHILLKPIPTVFYASLRKLDIMDALSLIPMFFLFIYALGLLEYSPHLSDILAMLYFMILALAFGFALFLSIGALQFWTILSYGPGRLLENIFNLGRVPSNAFQGITQIILIYVFPIVLFGTAPIQALLGTHPLGIMMYLTAFVAIALYCSFQFWQLALEHYSSAGG